MSVKRTHNKCYTVTITTEKMYLIYAFHVGKIVFVTRIFRGSGAFVYSLKPTTNWFSQRTTSTLGDCIHISTSAYDLEQPTWTNSRSGSIKMSPESPETRKSVRFYRYKLLPAADNWRDRQVIFPLVDVCGSRFSSSRGFCRQLKGATWNWNVYKSLSKFKIENGLLSLITHW